ncbi:MAG: hypothetical protein LBJ07_00520 [Actinomycetes bacterium]|jgi:hypothetical protein|nr:hypothetical protein [Actinomycetes bacterium]
MSKQRQMVVGLIVIAMLLAAVIIVIMQTTPTETGVEQTTATSDTSQQGQTSSIGSMGSDGSAIGADGQEIPFDEATAVRVPADQTPRQWVENYYKACDVEDWETAQQHLPATKQQVTSAADLQKQLEGYGITGYKITNESENGNELDIAADQETASYGTFTSIWTFVKSGDGDGAWLLKNKAVAAIN